MTDSQLKPAVELSGRIEKVLDESVLYCNEHIKPREVNTETQLSPAVSGNISNTCVTECVNLNSGTQKRRSLAGCDGASSEVTVCEERYCEEVFSLRPKIDGVEWLDNKTPLFVQPRDLHMVPESKLHRAFTIPSGWAETFS